MKAHDLDQANAAAVVSLLSQAKHRRVISATLPQGHRVTVVVATDYEPPP